MKERHRSAAWLVAAVSILISFSTLAEAAGFVEVGAAVNYRRSAFDSDNFEQLLSYTTSISYYFMEMSALELSYTYGQSIISVKAGDPDDPVYLTQTLFQLLALDFVFALAQKDDMFQPYVKIGGGYLKNNVYQEVNGAYNQLITHQEGLVPSAGIGFKLMVTKQFGVKFGLDAWTTPPTEQPVTVDYAGTAGISWMF